MGILSLMFTVCWALFVYVHNKGTSFYILIPCLHYMIFSLLGSLRTGFCSPPQIGVAWIIKYEHLKTPLGRSATAWLSRRLKLNIWNTKYPEVSWWQNKERQPMRAETRIVIKCRSDLANHGSNRCGGLLTNQCLQWKISACAFHLRISCFTCHMSFWYKTTLRPDFDLCNVM